MTQRHDIDSVTELVRAFEDVYTRLSQVETRLTWLVSGAEQIDASIIANLTADEIEAGTLSSDVTVSGVFGTALSGARVVMDSGGIKGYNGSDVLQAEIRASDGAISAAGGDVLITENGIVVRGSQILEVEDSGGVTQGHVDAASGVMQVTGQNALALVSGAFTASPPGSSLYLASVLNEHIILESGADIVRPHDTGTDLGNSTDYWREIHYETAVTHTPAMPSELSGRDVVSNVTRRSDGVIDKEALPEEMVVRPQREDAIQHIMTHRHRERAARMDQASKAPDRTPWQRRRDVDAIASETIPEPTEEEIQAELARPDAVGFKVDVLVMSTAEAVRDLITEVDRLRSEVESLKSQG